MSKPRVYYMATQPDGTVPRSTEAGTPVSLADHVGQVIDHPTPCKTRWYDETHFSYFRAYHRLGEVLNDLWQWPARLFVVEPLGETGNWAQRDYPYRLLAHQIRVIEETEAWPALGPNGRAVEQLLTAELPDLILGWLRDWDAGPDAMERRFEIWRHLGADDCTSGMNAENSAFSISRSARRYAAASTARRIGIDMAYTAARESGASEKATAYAARRADNLIHAVLLKDRMREYSLKALRGTDLDADTARLLV
ncbi:hypothetical protein [Streptomyces zaomyceticus]|uniref:hypothetical protein n=1 Tax=Streptomyces zaomyceticus TaxID=68286 RepID=UPI0036C5E6C1